MHKALAFRKMYMHFKYCKILYNKSGCINQKHISPGFPSAHTCQDLRKSSYQATHSHQRRTREETKMKEQKTQQRQDKASKPKITIFLIPDA